MGRPSLRDGRRDIPLFPLIPANAGTQIIRRNRLAFWVYIVASKRNGTIYVGHTDNIIGRIAVHREGAPGSFSRKYGCTLLVWYEQHATRESAFRRERAIKEWRRSWKLLLIEEKNPTWEDLSARIHDQLTSAAPCDLGPGIRRDEREEKG